MVQVFLVEGEIGSGKTTLVNGLASVLRARGYRVGVALEPVEKWREIGILGKFYDDPERYGYAFQSFVYTTRIQEISRMAAENADADVYILERSPATDKIFMNLTTPKLGSNAEMFSKMYSLWCDTFDQLLPFRIADATVLYLKPSLEVCMQRIASRNRGEEILHKNEAHKTSGVSQEYQALLRRGHEAMFLGMHPGEFPGLKRGMFREVITVPQTLADAEFREGHRGPALEEILGLMGVTEC
jgi:deoxyadenosine/deoxycytidine kinase